VADQVVDVILQFGAPHFELFDFLIGRKINFFLDSVNRVIQSVIFVEHFSEMVVGAFEPTNDFTMFREFAQDWMMEVHGGFWNCYVSGLFVDGSHERTEFSDPKMGG